MNRLISLLVLPPDSITYPTQLVCYLAELAAERQVAVTEAIRDCLEAARTLGGAPLVTHERLAYLAHQKGLRLQVVVADALESLAAGFRPGASLPVSAAPRLGPLLRLRQRLRAAPRRWTRRYC